MRLFLLLSLTLGCASGGFPGNDDASTRDVGTDSSCVPSCRSDETCVSGRCVNAGNDADGDTIPFEVDCDDSDPGVGRTAVRPCGGECGVGMEVCTDGLWGACSVPDDCDCTDGDAPRVIGCGFCGQQTQECIGGTWTNMGSCLNEGVCSPGAMENRACETGGDDVRLCGVDCQWGDWSCTGGPTDCSAGEIDRETEACGTCGGMRERTRTCSGGAWGAWSAWGSCSDGGGGECSPGQTENDSQGCGNCNSGTQTRSRTCGSDCRWGSWSAFSSCSGGGACASGATRACPNGDSCGVQRCGSSCTWGSTCEPATPGGCLRIRPGTSGPAGNNYRCCTPGGGGSGWQFCLPSCAWSTACEAHSC